MRFVASLSILSCVALTHPVNAAAQSTQTWVVSWIGSVQGPYPVGNPSAQPDMKLAFRSRTAWLRRFQGRERDVRDESASVCLGGAGRQCIEAVLPLATDEVRVDVRAPSRSAVFRYGQHVSAVERVFTRHNPLVSKSGKLSRVITTRSH